MQKTEAPPRLTYHRLELPVVLGVSVATIDRMLKSGELPYVKLRKRVVVPRTVIDRFLEVERAA